jgi:arginine decarboxylase
MNYSVAQYAHAIVRTLWEICVEYSLPHPQIVSESGRALTAHHAVLVTEVVNTETVPADDPAPPAEDAPLILHDLWEGFQSAAGRTAIEVYQDALYWIGEVREMYLHSVLTLGERAHAERIYQALCHRLHANLRPASRAHRAILDDLDERLADKYFCNLSIFQSLPDIWAIDQVFPIMPLNRLDEAPSRRAVLQDLTCDSDGRIERYVDREGLEATLAVHPLKPGEPYLLGFFLVGAYQEILGDMHNLFGDTNSVNVELTPDGVKLAQPEHGDSADKLLTYVHFDPGELIESYRRKIAAAELNERLREQYLEELRNGLTGYTYLEG